MVIFATNLAQNYDKTFVTRIKSIHFKKPNFDMRKKLWGIMLLPQLTLSTINIEKLAAIDNVCGRDIKNVIIKTGIQTAIDNKAYITQKTLEETLASIILT
jgi:ATP-dependent 26S proteasome regulatory subunit